MTTIRGRQVVNIEQVLPGKPLPAGVQAWPDEDGLRPRDTSLGYCDTSTPFPSRVHVFARDWIVTDIERGRHVFTAAEYESAQWLHSWRPGEADSGDGDEIVFASQTATIRKRDLTWDKLRELGRQNPQVAAALRLHDRGNITAEQTLIAAILLLHESLKRANREIMELAKERLAGAFGFRSADVEDALDALSEHGITGKDADTAFRSLLNRLTSDTPQAKEALALLGITLYDAGGKLLPLPEIRAQLGQALSQLSDEQSTQFTLTLAGAYGMNALSVIVRHWLGVKANEA